jgi:Fur family ferric uptake transcriptional regulator
MQRNTKQREAIKDVFCTSDRPLTVAEVRELAGRTVSGIGIATVYRNIKALADEGWLQVIEVFGDGPRYEQSGAAHHHHFLCNRCERVYNIEGCLGGMETLLPRGFQMESHDLLLTGLCAKCGGDR